MVQKTYKIALLLALLFSPIVKAEVSLEFNAVTIPELAQTVFKGIIKKNYVLSPEVLADARTLTLSIKNTKETDLLPFLKQLFNENGIELNERNGYIYLTKQKSSETPLPVNEQTATTSQNSEPLLSNASEPQGSGASGKDTQIYTYRPLYRKQKEVTELLKFAGAITIESTVDDVVFYKADLQKQLIIVDLLNELDKPSSQVIVKAYIYEVSNTQRDVTAINAAITLLNGKLGLKLDGTAQANQLNLTFPDASLILSAFNSDNRFKQVSAPSLRVKNGENSRFSVGTETPVISTTTTTQIGSAVQSIIYKSSGVILDITPRILQDSIELDISQQLSSFIPTTTGVNNSPTLIKREIKTTISTKDGEIIILGGLDESKLSHQKTGLKFLPDWLQSKDNSDDKSDILLVMQVQKI